MNSEKEDQPGSHAIAVPSSENATVPKDVDEAYEYLSRVQINDESPSNINLAALRHKIDWRIVPIMFCCYTMQFLDKVSLNVRKRCSRESRSCYLHTYQYSAVMGLEKDLGLKGNDFSNTATAFFVAFLIAEIPNGE